MNVVLLFPGQGSQKPGMGKDLYETFPAAREVFDAADSALGHEDGARLSSLCFNGPADELTLTHNAQPALLAHGAAVWAVTRDRLTPHVRADGAREGGRRETRHPSQCQRRIPFGAHGNGFRWPIASRCVNVFYKSEVPGLCQCERGAGHAGRPGSPTSAATAHAPRPVDG